VQDGVGPSARLPPGQPNSMLVTHAKEKKRKKFDRSGTFFLDLGSNQGLTDGDVRRGGGARRREGREAMESCSPAEELLLFHLIQTAARGRR
jgi:hypothetical protein